MHNALDYSSRTYGTPNALAHNIVPLFGVPYALSLNRIMHLELFSKYHIDTSALIKYTWEIECDLSSNWSSFSAVNSIRTHCILHSTHVLSLIRVL